VAEGCCHHIELIGVSPCTELSHRSDSIIAEKSENVDISGTLILSSYSVGVKFMFYMHAKHGLNRTYVHRLYLIPS
jgi:hypothetical protein